MEWKQWLDRWDLQQTKYLPHREHSFDLMLSLVETTLQNGCGRVLDLACGCGSITSRLLKRFPKVEVVGLDLDPVLLMIARGNFSEEPRVTTAEADLRNPDWTHALPIGGFDAVVTATALHWLPENILAQVYKDLAGIVRPGGIFLNADHMPLDHSPVTMQRAKQIKEQRFAESIGEDWGAWWDAVRLESVFQHALIERETRFGPLATAEFMPQESWHLEHLKKAGFSESTIIGRSLDEAIAAAIR